MSVFWEIHQDLPREGPGDNASTRKAFQMLTDLPPQPQILDIGCGPGMQTIELARNSNASITAIDNYQPFLDSLKQSSLEAGLSDRITVLKQSMFYMDFSPASFDVIWSEGAIYIIGFRQGLQLWKEYLKPLGYIAVTEVSWLKPDPPEPIKRFWSVNYPSMGTMDENSKVIQDLDYTEVGKFVLPESAWWDHYYNPVLRRVSMLRAKFAGNSEAIQELDAQQQEIAMYRKYSAYYGYVFYIMRRNAES